MTSSQDQLSQLSDRAKQVRQRVADARTQTKSGLEKAVTGSRATAKAQAAELRDRANAAKDKLSTWWDESNKGLERQCSEATQGPRRQKGRARRQPSRGTSRKGRGRRRLRRAVRVRGHRRSRVRRPQLHPCPPDGGRPGGRQRSRQALNEQMAPRRLPSRTGRHDHITDEQERYRASSPTRRPRHSLRRTDLESKDDRVDPPEQGIEAHPEQEKRGAGREILLRRPKAKTELEEPGN